MNSFRFLQLLFIAVLSAFGVDALASRQVPSAGVSASDQASFGGYSYGESCLFGGSASYSSSNLWAGRKTEAKPSKENMKELPTFPTTFVPNKKISRDSSFTPRQQ